MLFLYISSISVIQSDNLLVVLSPTLIEKFEIFNLSSKNYRIIEIAEHIQKRLPTALLEITNIPFEDERNYRVSNAKIKAKFLADNYTIDDTINDIIGVYKDGRIKNFSDIIYSNVGKVEFKI